MNPNYAALIVDDEPAVRQLTLTALRQRCFACDEAEDGDQAMERVRQKKYDVIITDLRMPRRHGHSFVQEVLEAPAPRPLLIVVTGIAEPRLALDLIARGVDDILLKPVDFKVLAAKIEALCKRRAAGSAPPPTPADGGVHRDLDGKSPFILDSALSNDSESQSALALAGRFRLEKLDGRQLQEAMREVPNLRPDVIETIHGIHGIHGALDGGIQATDRDSLGSISGGVLADLTIAAMLKQTLARIHPEWSDPQVVFQRSTLGLMALSQALPGEILTRNSDLMLAAILEPILRPLVGAVMPELYRRLIEECRESRLSLVQLERRRGLPSPIKLMEPSLLRWGIPRSVIDLLEFSLLSHRETTALTPTLRSKVRRHKIAALLGQIAQGRFYPWDEIDIPTLSVAHQLGFPKPSEVIRLITLKRGETREQQHGGLSSPAQLASEQRPAKFMSLISPADSFVELIAKSHGFARLKQRQAEGSLATSDVINAIDCRPERVRQLVLHRRLGPLPIVICTETPTLGSSNECSLLQLPCSAAAFNQVMNRVSEKKGLEAISA